MTRVLNGEGAEHEPLPNDAQAVGVRIVLEDEEGRIVSESFGAGESAWELRKQGRGWTMVERDDVDWAMLADLRRPEGEQAALLPSTASEEAETGQDGNASLGMRGQLGQGPHDAARRASGDLGDGGGIVGDAPPSHREKTPELGSVTPRQNRKLTVPKSLKTWRTWRTWKMPEEIRRPRGRRRWSPTTLRPMEILPEETLAVVESLSCARLRMFSRVGMRPRRRRWP